MKKTIAQQLNVKEFPFVIKDSNGNVIYYENSDEFWAKREYDSNGNVIYFEDSDEFWAKREYDSKGNKIYFEDSDGYWAKREYDSNGNEIYFENSDGNVVDNRPKEIELTLDEIANKLGVDVSKLKNLSGYGDKCITIKIMLK
jgi:hypothetical protein